jgi:Flp pilus assembly protein TadB
VYVNYIIVLSVLAAAAVFALVFAFAMPAHPAKPVKMDRSKAPSKYPGIQARLDKAQIEVPAEKFVMDSLKLGIPIGLGLLILVGSVMLVPVGVLAGFLFQYSKLERERDTKLIKYMKQLAAASDIITNSYSVRPSLTRALNSAAEFSNTPLREDFQEMIVGFRQGEFEATLQRLADKRRSIVFDTVANALIRAKDESGQVKEIMEKLSVSTRQNTASFEDAITSQVNARSSIMWGTFGPWLIFAAFRGMTLFLNFNNSGNLFASANGFFNTLQGNAVALIAALISIGIYVYGYKLSQRGLVVRRVMTVDATSLKAGQTTNQSNAASPRKPVPHWTSPNGKGPVQIPVTDS